MARQKPVRTPVRDLSKQSEKMGMPKSSMTPLYLGTTGTDHKPAVNYTQLGESEGYPRGFTPDQMREVKSSESAGDLVLESDSPAGQSKYPDRPHPEHEKSRVREMIARSRIQPSTQFNRFRKGGPNPIDPLKITARSKSTMGDGGTVGEYFSPMNGNQGRRDVDIRTDALFPERHKPEDTAQVSHNSLIHELGHDNDYLTDTSKSLTDPHFNSLEENQKLIIGSGVGMMMRNPAKFEELLKSFTETKESVYGYHQGHLEGYADKFAEDNHVDDPRSVRKKQPWVGREDSPYAGETAAAHQKILRGAGDPVTNGWVSGFAKSKAKVASPGSHILRLLNKAVPPGYSVDSPALGNALRGSGTSSLTGVDIEKAYKGDETAQ